LAVAIDECLRGGLRGKINVIVNYRDTECLYAQKKDWNNLKSSQKYLFFLSDTTTETDTTTPVYIIQWEAMISLENDAEAMITTVKEALPIFRNPWENTTIYYTLLRAHCQSPLQRIRKRAHLRFTNGSSGERPEGVHFPVPKSDGDLQERSEAGFGPELTSAFEAVLELRAEGFDGAAADGDAQIGVGGVVHVPGMVSEVGVLFADCLQHRRVGGGGSSSSSSSVLNRRLGDLC
jgi:hypothetical protein